MKIKILGAHNCESARTSLVSLLVDDVLALDAGGLTSHLSFTAQQKLKAVILTHHHYDHIRDIPTLAMNFFLRDKIIDIFSSIQVYDVLTTHLLNDRVYPDFFKKPPEKPALRFTEIVPGEVRSIEGYSVLALPVSHSIPATGFQVTSPEGKSLFYTGDTGPGLAGLWRHISPRLLIIEVTASDDYESFAMKSRHLTPGLLKHELDDFRKLKGYLPRVVAIHLNPTEEKKIATELAAIARQVSTEITLAAEGMALEI